MFVVQVGRVTIEHVLSEYKNHFGVLMEVSRFKTGVLISTGEFNHKISFLTFKNFVWSIVCWLKR